MNNLIRISTLWMFCVAGCGFLFSSAAALNHPGLHINQEEIERIKQKIAAGEQPQKKTFDKLKSSSLASLSYTPHPKSHIDIPVVTVEKSITDDSRAALTQALLWVLTGNEQYAKNVIKILDAWGSTFKSIEGGNAHLQLGWSGHPFARAAELVKHTYSGWDPDAEQRIAKMFRDVFIPTVKVYRGGIAGNQGALMTNSCLAIAVFLDDQALFDSQIENARRRINRYIYENGQTQETCRDLGHSHMGIGALARCAEIAWHQGIDLYSENNNGIYRAAEFQAMHVLKMQNRPPADHSSPHGTCYMNTDLRNMKNHNERANGWEIIYNHYHNRKGLYAENIKKMVDDIRPDGILRWGEGPGSLTHANMATPPAVLIIPHGGSFLEQVYVTLQADGALDVYYTLDGSSPSPSSTQYTEPFTLENTATVTAAAFEGSTMKGEPVKATFTKVAARPATTPGGEIKSGVLYEYHTGSYTRLPDFNPVTPERTGTIASFNKIPNAADTDYAVRYYGYIKVEKTAAYRFYTKSDDGSKLFVGDTLLIDADGQHSATEESGVISLAEGYHRIMVGYFQASGSQTLDVFLEGRGIAKKRIPADMLFNDGTVPAVSTIVIAKQFKRAPGIRVVGRRFMISHDKELLKSIVLFDCRGKEIDGAFNAHTGCYVPKQKLGAGAYVMRLLFRDGTGLHAKVIMK